MEERLQSANTLLSKLLSFQPHSTNMQDFNRNHPERHEDEVFIGNFFDEDGESAFEQIGWQTKRRGLNTYTKDRKLIFIDGTYPVFVKKSEIQNSPNGEKILEGLLPG
ncbi:MAG: hypothetical protein RLY49_434 [Candidatus Parcubacteria bacterium]